MMKIKFFLLCLGWLSLAQAQQLRPEVVASAGSSVADLGGTARLQFTVGESVILGQSLSSFSYGQGFHNGVLLTVGLVDLDLAAWGIKVWPNPVANTLFLQFTPPSQRDFLTASVWNLLGQPILAEFRLDGVDPKSIPVGQLPAGVYLLRLADPSGKSVAIKFVKAD